MPQPEQSDTRHSATPTAVNHADPRPKQLSIERRLFSTAVVFDADADGNQAQGSASATSRIAVTVTVTDVTDCLCRES